MRVRESVRTRVVGAIAIGALTFGLCLAGTSAASAKSLELTTAGQPVGVGAKVFYDGFWTMTIGTNTFKCNGPIEGTLSSNDMKTDKASLTQTSGGWEGLSTACDGLVVHATGFPWTLSLGASHKASLGPVRLIIEGCTYTAKKLKGPEVLEAPEERLRASLSGKFKETAGSCPTTSFTVHTQEHLGYSFAVSQNGGQDTFIDGAFH